MKKICIAILMVLCLLSGTVSFAEEGLTHFTGKVGYSVDFPADLFRVEAAGINTTFVPLDDDVIMNITVLPSEEPLEDPVGHLLDAAKEFGVDKKAEDIHTFETNSGAKVWALLFTYDNCTSDIYYVQQEGREFLFDVWAMSKTDDKYFDAAQKIVLSFVNEPDGDMSGYEEEEEFEFEEDYGSIMLSEYEDIIGTYARAANENWEPDKLNEMGMSELPAFMGKDALKIMVSFESLNGDEDEQLLLTTKTGENNDQLELVALIQKEENGQYNVIATSRERDYYILCGNETEGYTIMEHASSGATQSSISFWKLDSAGQLAFIEGVVYDEEKCYLVSEKDQDLSTAKACSDEEAETVIKRYVPVGELDVMMELQDYIDGLQEAAEKGQN